MVDVAVIGGGLSGLSAAVELASRGASVALYEAAPKLGGRCYSYIDKPTGDVVDNGQHVLLGAYRHLLRYLEIVGTRGYLREQPALRLPLFHPVKGLADFRIDALPRPLDLAAAVLKFRLLTLQDRRRLLNVALALRKLNAAGEREIARLTVEEWLTELRQSRDARHSLWYPIAISALNEVPERASALLFARVLRAAFLGSRGDSAVLIPTVGQSELYVRGAEEYLRSRRAKIHANEAVTSIEVRGSEVTGLRLAGGRLVRARHIVCAVPHDRLRRLIPQALRSSFADLEQLGSSPIISLHLWFDNEFMEEDFVGLIDCTLQWVFNRRRIAGRGPNGWGFLSAVISGAREIVDLPKEQIIALALRDLHRVFPASHAAALRRSIVIKEKRATFSATPDAEALRPSAETPLPNFILAGDWTATGLPATIEGAVKSGFAAANLIRR